MGTGGLSFFAGIGERIREGAELYETLKDGDLLKHLHVLWPDGPKPGAKVFNCN